MIPEWLHGLEVAMIDTETQGLDGVFDRVVEVAVVVGKFESSTEAPTIVRSWSSLVYPEGPISPEVTKVHGISDADVFGQPRFGEIADRFIDVVGTALPAAYNADFDRRMIGAEMIRAYAERPAGQRPPAWSGFEAKWLDVYVWGRRFQRFQPGKKKLTNVAERLGIQAPPNLHRAEADAGLALMCLWKLAQDDRFPRVSLADTLAFQTAMGAVERGDLLMHLYKKGVLTK